MSRKPRFNLTGIPQHVIQRGNNREPSFFSTEDYLRYLQDLEEAAEGNNVAIHAYVLMTNHVHLLVTPGQSFGITYMMQDLGRKYVRYINRTYHRTGTLWEGRYKASLVDSEAYLLTCMRYIEMNPVRANMVEHPVEYRWTSYAANAQDNKNSLITPHPIYIGLGGNLNQRQHSYRELFNTDLDKEQIHEIRNAMNQELVLGRDDFRKKIEDMTKRQVRPGKLGRPSIKENGSIYYVL